MTDFLVIKENDNEKNITVQTTSHEIKVEKESAFDVSLVQDTNQIIVEEGGQYEVIAQPMNDSVSVSTTEVSVTVSAAGVDGQAGQGLPMGGTTGQVPAKASDDDYDIEWVDQAEAVYTGNSPTTVTVGGLTAGTAIAGETFSSIIEQAFAPYVAPTFSSFAISNTTPVEVGTTISGSKSFTFAFTQSANVAASSVAIIDVTAGNVSIATGLSTTSPVSANVGSVQLTAQGSYSWKGQATNTHSTVFNSSNSTVNWYWKRYVGTSTNATLTEAQIEALTTSALAASFAATFSMAAGGYKYFCWADSLGSPTASTGFKDTATNIAIDMATVSDNAAYSNVANGWYYALVSVTNAQSITTNYRVYRSRFVLASAVNVQVS